MNIIAVDDERFVLMDLEQAIREAAPDALVFPFSSPVEGISFVRDNRVDVAFLDIEMTTMTGVELAMHIREISPRTNIIFVTGHGEYMSDAFALHASGYIFKPVSPIHIARELDHLRYPVECGAADRRVRAQCFGNFEVFLDGEPLVFPRSKSKELFAYLVDRRGAGVSGAEICAVLWEDRPYTRSMQKQVQTIIYELLRTLRDAGVEDVIFRRRNSIAVNVDKIDCDYYDFLDAKTAASVAYTGEYMANYTWAELTAGYLINRE